MSYCSKCDISFEQKRCPSCAKLYYERLKTSCLVRTCKKCGTDFRGRGCLFCKKKYIKEYRLKNRSILNDIHTKWRLTTKEKTSTCRKCGNDFTGYACKICKKRQTEERNILDNPRKCVKCGVKFSFGYCKACKQIRWSKYNESHAEEQKQRRKEWEVKNRSIRRVYGQNRRALKKATGGKLSRDLSQKLLQLQRGKCACCFTSLEKGYDMDHIQPLARGGIHEDGNIQLLCPRCNSRKSAKDPIEFMQSMGKLC